MKRILALLFALVMLLALTACGKDEEGTPTGESTGATTNTTESTNGATDGTQDSTQGTTESTAGGDNTETTEPSATTPPTTTTSPTTPPTTTPPTTTPPATTPTACSHSWKDATCTTAKTCSKCGATEGNATGHSWNAATTDTPKTCKYCGLTDGEPLGPIKISTLSEFLAMTDGEYVLANNIDFSGCTTTIESFSGTLDGNMYTLENVSLASVFYWNLGTIKNLKLNCDIDCTSWQVAGLTIYNRGTVENCHSNGYIRGSCPNDGGNQTAGLVLYNQGVVRYCTNSATVISNGEYINEIGNLAHAEASAGGLVYSNSWWVLDGYEQYPIIEFCANFGTICGEKHQGHGGGICYSNDSTIQNCFNVGICNECMSNSTGSANSSSSIGGIANYNGIDGYIKYCYDATTAGIVTSNGNFIIDCYALKDVSNSNNGDDSVVVLTPNEMKQQASYKAFDFETIWMFADGYDYPMLRNLKR